MGMPVTVEVVGETDGTMVDAVFSYFEGVDRRFSTYKSDSEITAINRARLARAECSSEMGEVFALAEHTKRQTDGFFDIRKTDGTLNPSGIVKGWAIRNAAGIIADTGARDFFIDAGGDIQSSGVNALGKEWSVGIRNPFNAAQVIKVIHPRGRGIATSGNYVRGQHIYNPHAPDRPIADIISLTVIGPDVLEADRFATAAFAMGKAGIHFIERMPGLEGYVVDRAGRATLTSNFGAYCTP
jgi:thiamine biosynthesis lipoprotein